MSSTTPWPMQLGFMLRRQLGLDPTVLGGEDATIGPLVESDDAVEAPSQLRQILAMSRPGPVRAAVPEPEVVAPPVAEAPPSPSWYEPGSPVDRLFSGIGGAARGIGYAASPAMLMDVGRGLTTAPKPQPDRLLPPLKTGVGELKPFPGAAGSEPTTSITAASTAPISAPTRAIRMPDGRVVFTNRGDLEGEEVGMDEATRPRSFAGGGPVKETMAALVRSQTNPVRYAEDAPKIQSFNLRKPPSLGSLAPRMTAGTDPGAGGVSTFSGTPEQQMERKLQDAFAAAALAGAERDTKMAKMDPAEAALLANKDVGTIAYLVNQFQPQIAEATKRAQAKVALVRKTVADPKMQREAIMVAEDDLAREVKPLQDMLAVLRSVRPSQ